MLLISIVNLSAKAATPAEQVPALVQTAARQHLERQAQAAGWVAPQIVVEVVRGSRPLASCPALPTVAAVDTRLASRMRFAAVCAGGAAEAWRYEFVVRAQISAKVVVSAAEVAAGRVLTADDLLLERHDISAMPDSLADVNAALGQAARRTLRAGEVLRPAMLAAPTLVKRGDAVRIVARREQVEVSMAGEALDSGARGTVLRVRNANGATIRARVSAAGTVEPVDLPVSIQSPD
ncbi:flagellar basal body P-ring formation chaperone FlgA [Rugamonas sp. CCM 8940]|uniref:flagellar basal body P-ring formation chaperone FlgA n=1 Tax=Rugamonas sp. CCM 8940 TaxID=2765359 RepID=UPI001F340CAC|nr:flagellar basal body P-ring formation chaperone FlgA [Rugamonas sp. CCM 8940]